MSEAMREWIETGSWPVEDENADGERDAPEPDDWSSDRAEAREFPQEPLY